MTLLKNIHWWITNLLVDPLEILRKAQALPQFLRNKRLYDGLNRDPRFAFHLRDLWYRTHDRNAPAGSARGHYFFQDLWAAEHVWARRPAVHVDVGSRLDGFVAHLLPFCHVRYVDIRPLGLDWKNFEFTAGSVVDLPFEARSVDSLSCLHVIEHIGLGRYGDPVDPDGYRKAAAELARVLADDGELLIGTPVGRERLCFDAHRVFDPQTVVEIFAPLVMREFALIDDEGRTVHRNASFEAARSCDYGCGLFIFDRGPRRAHNPEEGG